MAEERKKRKFSKEGFKKLIGIFRYVLPYRGRFIVGLVLLFISSSLLMAFPFVAGKLLDIASGKADWITQSITTAALMLIGILFFQAVLSFMRVMLFAQVTEKAMAGIRTDIFERILSLPMVFFDRRRAGELISRITNDISLLQDTLSVTLAELIRQVVVLIVGTAVIFFTTPKLSLFMLGTFPIIIIVAFFFGKFIRKLSKKTQDQLAAANVIVEETIQSISSVKSFTSESYEAGRFSSAINKAVDIALRGAKYRALFISFIIFAIFGGIVAIMWFGANLVQQGDMSVGDLLSFVLYTTFIGASIGGLGNLFGQVQKAMGASERVLEIQEEETEDIVGETVPIDKTGSIVFERVEFSYPTRKEIQVIRGVSFEVGEGEKVALVGQSGAGKSTIVQLLMHFYAVDDGTIYIGNRQLTDLPLKTLRSAIGIVPQEVILFGGTLEENIRYGRPDASSVEIREAARKANALEFIETFPEGFNTMVGERGIKLSGGQRQRIAIARAILKDPKILILDEATSSLDAESEHLVQGAVVGKPDTAQGKTHGQAKGSKDDDGAGVFHWRLPAPLEISSETSTPVPKNTAVATRLPG